MAGAMAGEEEARTAANAAENTTGFLVIEPAGRAS